MPTPRPDETHSTYDLFSMPKVTPPESGRYVKLGGALIEGAYVPPVLTPHVPTGELLLSDEETAVLQGQELARAAVDRLVERTSATRSEPMTHSAQLRDGVINLRRKQNGS